MAISPFPWLRVGHWTDGDAKTGCTVIRFDGDVVASGEVRGGAPATREFALLEPTRLVESINAVCLSGGSAFGLAAADGALTALQADGIGYPTAHGVVPIVIGMSLYDLGVGARDIWPGATEGEIATRDASQEFDLGLIGAGAGATVGKWRGPDAARSGGLGFSVVAKGAVTVCAVVAVNAVGDIVGGTDVAAHIASGEFEWPDAPSALRENTTIGVIATNARVSKTECRTLAEAGHDGLARALVPAHGPTDGDALVAVARPEVNADLSHLRILAAAAIEQAIRVVAVP